ncbi:MAG: UDP-4-amino-4, 6-dideoxy-N-acetyl-beta-L-altrosamine transaminase [Candidatus Celerinatantimonas neptuna]|nr:MAG: UDP-4-amino-4, 6-dideoxy-N-acetyl-beta-L-altrosamine transaminase [Candidatus Celerinatantimonas neptuna]
MHDPVFYGKQTITQTDIDAVVGVLQSDFLTQGPVTQKFEKNIADLVSVPHAIACANGTAALHLACLGVDISDGDEVWVSAVSFVASANCARFCGATVRFVDIDPLTCNINLNHLELMLLQAKKKNSLPKAIIVVHLGGSSCDMQTLFELCQPFNIAIIEDACHALGGTYQNLPVGHSQYSQCCVFSFHPVKSITTAEGGMVVTRDPKIAERIRCLASHGITKNKNDWLTPSLEPWHYEQQQLGYNYRLSDIQAGLGCSQLKKLDQFLTQRRHIAENYRQAFAECLSMQSIPEQVSSAYHLAIIICQDAEQRLKIYQTLAKQHIFCQFHYIPIYRHPYYKDLVGDIARFYPGAEYYYQRALSLPIYPTLADDVQQYIIQQILSVLNEHCQVSIYNASAH